MKARSCLVMVTVLFAVSFAAAQMTPVISADVPFSFIVEGKTLPAGPYEFKENPGGNAIVVTDTKTHAGLFASVITRLGSTGDKEPDLVFDVTGTDHYLSEIHIPGIDGYLVKATPGKHTHVHVKGKK